mgnify:CR=1 FL=1
MGFPSRFARLSGMFRVFGFGQILSYVLLRFGFLFRAFLDANAVVSGDQPFKQQRHSPTAPLACHFT